MIRDAYGRAAEIIAAGEQRAESIEVAHEVERLRLAWRPPCVRIVMLAESHVWTSEREAASRVLQPDGVETGFARFVYCLGYGERTLVPDILPNTGTWQYWRLLHDSVREPAVSAAKIWPRKPPERIRAKLQLLGELKRAGIWLVDASVTALYQPPGRRLVSGSEYKKVLQACWETHVGEVIAGCAASAVLIVGKGVKDAIGDLVKKTVREVEVVKQPNAPMPHNEICGERLKVFNYCQRHTRA